MLCLLVIGPALAVGPISLTNWEFGLGFEFVGLENYSELLRDERFRRALGNTLVYAAVVAPVTVALGLAIATAIEKSGALAGFYSAAHFLPVVATMTAMALAWQQLLHPSLGLMNQALGAVGAAPRNWLIERQFALPTLMLIGVWHNVGFSIVMFLAGLRAIPRELTEASILDGASSPIDRMRTVTWPLLSPITFFVSVLTIKDALGLYDTVAVLTKGGPENATQTLLYLYAVESFDNLRAGYGSAIATVYLGLILALSALQFWLDKKANR